MSGGLSTEDWLVIHYEPLKKLEDGEQFDSYNDLNEMMLRYLCVMDDNLGEASDSELEGKGELHKLQLKTDLVLNLLGEMLWGQLRLTPPKWVRLSASEIRWQGKNDLQAEELIRLQIYPKRNFPIKLSFLARMLPPEEKDDGTILIGAELCEPSETLVYWLEKYIFQQHRRRVARHSDISAT